MIGYWHDTAMPSVSLSVTLCIVAIYNNTSYTPKISEYRKLSAPGTIVYFTTFKTPTPTPSS